jgi:hypothetical protein
MDIDVAIGTIELAHQMTQLNQEIAALQVVITHKKAEVDAKRIAIQRLHSKHCGRIRTFFEIMTDLMLQDYVVSGRKHCQTAKRILNIRTAEAQRKARAASKPQLTPKLPLMPGDSESEYWRD